MDEEEAYEEVTDMYEDEVTDQRSFLSFVRALIDDRADSVEKEALNPSNPFGPDANGWENVTIERFLEAAVAWAVDSDMGRKQGLKGDPSWRMFAAFLHAGKIYE